MFARGSWAIFGVRSDTEDAFSQSLDNFVNVSEASAVNKAKGDALPTNGINPFDFPRLDESTGDESSSAPLIDANSFRLGDHVYGFWFCLNGFEDVTDPKSKQEALAYEHAG